MTLEACVEGYMEQLVQQVKQRLQAAKAELFLYRKPHERASIKRNIETLMAVLDRLQGKTNDEHPTVTQQRQEIHLLRKDLYATQQKLHEGYEKDQGQRKIHSELKHQYNQKCIWHRDSLTAANKKNSDLLLQLDDAKMTYASRLSVASAINMVLMCRSNNYSKQLQEQMGIQEARQSTDFFDDIKNVQVQATVKRSFTENLPDTKEDEYKKIPKLQMAEEDPELKTVKDGPELQMSKEEPELQMVKDGPDLQIVKEGPELQTFNLEEELVEENKREMLHVSMSELQQITENLVSELWKEKNSRLKSQEVIIEKVQADVKDAIMRLKAIQQKLVEKKPKKKNVFMRLLKYLFPKCVK